MGDSPRIPVCAWPDGRVIRRQVFDAHLDLDDLYFDSAPSAEEPADVEFSFYTGFGGFAFPGSLNHERLNHERLSASVARDQAGKLVWFVLNVGLVKPGTYLPTDLFTADWEWQTPIQQATGVGRLGLPLFIGDDRIQTDQRHDGAGFTDPDLRDLVSRTFPRESHADFLCFRASGTPAEGWGMLTFDLRIPSLEPFGARWLAVSANRLEWRVEVGSAAGTGPTLGLAVLDLLRLDHVLLESQRAAWEAQLEPGTFVHDDSLFRFLGEPSPVLWPQDRFLEWVSGG